MDTKNKFCISKKIFFSLLFLFLFFVSLLVINKINKNKQTTQTKAAPHQIIGGHPADPGEWPFTGFLFFNKYLYRPMSYNFYCGAILISNQWVLTAAHCVESAENEEDINEKDIGIIFNINYLDDENISENIFKVQKIIIHEFYKNLNSNFDINVNDIALLKLKKTTDIPFVAINNDQKQVKEGIMGYAMGWGSTLDKKASNELLEINLTIDLYDPLYRRDQKGGRPINSFFTYKGEGEGPSFGDSGGPFVIWYNNKYYLSGVSYSRTINFPNKFHSRGAVMVNVERYTDWIESKTGININNNNQRSFIGKPPEWIILTPTPIRRRQIYRTIN